MMISGSFSAVDTAIALPSQCAVAAAVDAEARTAGEKTAAVEERRGVKEVTGVVWGKQHSNLTER